MILTKFILREPGNHHEVGKGKLPAVPRGGEGVILNDKFREVHSVEWDVTKMEVTIYLNP